MKSLRFLPCLLCLCSLAWADGTAVADGSGPVRSAPEAGEPAAISRISAQVEADAIIIRYRASTTARNLILYRSASPLTDARSLLGAAIAGVFRDSDGSFTDYPVPGIDYYYGIIDEEVLKAASFSFRPGVDATATPIRIQAGPVRNGLKAAPVPERSLPLPYLALTAGVSSGEPLAESAVPEPGTVSPATREAIDAITAGIVPEQPDAPAQDILPEERRSGLLGEEYTLRLIVDDQFRPGHYREGIDALESFLTLHRTPGTAARARFYLGQAYLFTGDRNRAFFSFLEAQDRYEAATRPWIEYLLTVLHE